MYLLRIKFVFSKRFLLAAAAIPIFSLAPSTLGAQIVDRVITNVNGHVVLQSDWEQEIAFEALASGRAPDSFTNTERRAALDRLIDQELLREQVRPSQPVSADQIAARKAEVRKANPDATTDAGWIAKVQRYGLTEHDIEKRVSDELQLMKLVEDRLRPSIQIDENAVKNYYQSQLLPEMQKAGAHATPLNEVFGQIKNLLTEKKMNELLTGWLANLRSGSHINPPESSAGEQNR
jgi:hypothetical protein